jgi:hypothetical protein
MQVWQVTRYQYIGKHNNNVFPISSVVMWNIMTTKLHAIICPFNYISYDIICQLIHILGGKKDFFCVCVLKTVSSTVIAHNQQTIYYSLDFCVVYLSVRLLNYLFLRFWYLFLEWYFLFSILVEANTLLVFF